jgi:hypothetical protein
MASAILALVHPLVALVIAMAVAKLVLGVITAMISLYDVPEAYENDEGFWALDDGEDAAKEPARIPIVPRDRAREQPADSDA